MIKASMIMHGVSSMNAQLGAGMQVAKSWYAQGTVLSFDRVFFFQGILFLGVIPLLFFLRVPRTGEKAHIDLGME